MRRPRLLAIPELAVVAAFAVLAAGCGGSSSGSPRVATVGAVTTTASTTQPSLDAYAHCMRSHGVPSFPDPDSTGGIPKLQVVNARQSDPSRFDSADADCRALLPNGSLAPPESAQQRRTDLANMLSFAKCMRRRGVSNFPDPTAQQGITVAYVEAHGVDVHSTVVLRVVQECLPASHGGLTAAKVREALQNNP